MKAEEFLKGRGAQYNPANKYLKQEYVAEHIEGLDEPMLSDSKTEFLPTHPKTIVNKIDSPDLGIGYSLNPYQGCEHGCVYCYARNSHQYWGYGAGLDFERKIIVKENAPVLLIKQLESKNWQPMPIMLAGNTDCYQPIEAKKKPAENEWEAIRQHEFELSRGDLGVEEIHARRMHLDEYVVVPDRRLRHVDEVTAVLAFVAIDREGLHPKRSLIGLCMCARAPRVMSSASTSSAPDSMPSST